MNTQLRLSPQELEIIKTTAKEMFGENIRLYVFGSRADLNRKGGDIDIFLETETPVSVKDEIRFLAKLELKGIERKVDLVVKAPGRKETPIHTEAKQKGVRVL